MIDRLLLELYMPLATMDCATHQRDRSAEMADESDASEASNGTIHDGAESAADPCNRYSSPYGPWDKNVPTIHQRFPNLDGRLLQDAVRHFYVNAEHERLDFFDADGNRLLERHELNRSQGNTRRRYKDIALKNGFVLGARGGIIVVEDHVTRRSPQTGKCFKVSKVIGGGHTVDGIYDAIE